MKTKILYMGYGRTGSRGLELLIEAGAEIVAVVPRKSDAGTSSHSVRATALDREIPVIDPKTPHDPSFLADVARLAPDLIVSVQYDRILRSALLEIPRATLNLHFGPLPRLRGCFPTKWAIIENEPAGVTLHHIDPGIDTGPIIDRTIVPLSPDETDATLYAKLESSAISLLEQNASLIARGAISGGTRQDEARASYHPKEIPLGGVVDWDRPSEEVSRLIRAFTFPPHPAARAEILGRSVEIRAPLTIRSESSLPPGSCRLEVEGEARLWIGCGSGEIGITEVQLDGARIPVAEFATEHELEPLNS